MQEYWIHDGTSGISTGTGRRKVLGAELGIVSNPNQHHLQIQHLQTFPNPFDHHAYDINKTSNLNNSLCILLHVHLITTHFSSLYLYYFIISATT